MLRWLLVVLALGSAACRGGDNADSPDAGVRLRITWWGGETRHNVTLAALELFQERFPDIEVVPEFQGQNGYWARLATLTAGGNPPDVYQHNFSFLNEYVARGALLRLDTREEIDLSAWDETIANQGVRDSQRFAVPAGGNVQALLFDIEAVAAAGIDASELTGDLTWERFAELATKLGEAGGRNFYGINDGGGTVDVFEVWLKQRGKQFFDEDGTLGFEPEDAAAYWTFWNGLRASGAVPPIDLTTQLGDNLATFPLTLGKAAMHLGFSAQFNAYSDASGRSLGLAPYPNGGADMKPGSFFIGTGLMWSASAATKHPAEAALLINFLVNDRDAVTAQGLERGVPLSGAGRDRIIPSARDELVIDYVSAQARGGNLARDSVLYGNPPPGAGEVQKLFADGNDEVGFGAASARDAARSLFEKAQAVLAESRPRD